MFAILIRALGSVGAWVRWVRAASGLTAVQIAESVDGRRWIVAHVGSAHTEVELGLLLEQARQMLHMSGQDVLDLGVDATPRRVRLASSATDPTLFSQRQRAGERTVQLAVEPRVAPGRVVGTSSRLLFGDPAQVSSTLGFAVVGDDTSRDLVIA